MKRREILRQGSYTGSVAAAIILLVLTPASAQEAPPIRFTGLDGNVEFGLQWEDQESQSSGSSQTLSRLRREERIRLRLQGYSVDPQWIRFRLSGGFGLSQEDLTQSGRDLDSDGRLLEYDVSATFLERVRSRLTPFANRSQQIVSQELAPRREVIHENRGVTMRLDWLPLPSSLSYRHEETFQEASFAGTITRWNRAGDKFSYQGGRRWNRMDLNLQYRFEEVEDLVRPTFDYRFQQGAIFHRALLGAGSEYDLNTSARYFRREGPAPLVFSSLYVREQLTYRPTRTISGALGWIADRAQFEDRSLGLDEVSMTYTSFANVTHQLYESLSSQLTGDWVVTNFPVGGEDRYRARLTLNYQKKIPIQGRLLLGLNGRYEQTDRDTIGRTTVEEHEIFQAPPVSFTLSLPVATLSNLTVINPPKGITLLEGLDYTVTVAADQATIQIITTDPTRVAVGDRLLVRYEVVTLFPMRFETRAVGGRIGFSFSWISLSYQRERQGQRLLSGRDSSLLDDIVWENASLQFRLQPAGVTLYLLQQFRRYHAAQLSYQEWQFSQMIHYGISTRLKASLQAIESLTNYDVPSRETDRFESRLNLTWLPVTGMEVSPFAAYRRYEDTTAPDESIWNLGLRGRLEWGKLELSGFAQRETRRRNGSDIRDDQVDLRLVRRF